MRKPEIENVNQMLQAATERYPERMAVVEGDLRVTYGELSSGVGSLVEYLRLNGFGRRDKVGLLLPNSIEYAASFLAASAIGAVCVPIDTAFREEEIGFYIRHSALQLLLTTTELSDAAKSLVENTGTEVAMVKGEGADWSFPSGGGGSMAGVSEEVEPEDEAVYLYSTGSTGAPKRVARTHRNLVALAENHTQTIGWTHEDKILFAIPLSHTYALGNFLGALRIGAAMHMMEGFKRVRIADVIERERITVFPAVPFMLSILSDTRFPEPKDFSSLRMVISAGAPLSKEVFFKFRERFGVPPRQLYGSTETGVIAINMSDDPEGRLNSVGRPVKNVEVRVVKEDGSECGVGELGEIAVRSPSMTTGYWNLPEETARAFKGGWYFTGDLGRLDEEGYIYIEGRKKFVINVAGNKVDPVEVENLLITHPLIKEAAVVGVTNGDSEEMVKAVIVLEADGGGIGQRDIAAFLRDKIADYKIPRIVEFREEELPRSPTGKVLRERLK